MAVEASIVVVFGEEEPSDSDIVVVEFDPNHENNLDSEGKLKSIFDPDDTPVFLLHHSNTLQVVDILASSGTVSQIGSNIVQNREVSASFPKLESEVSLGYDEITSGSMAWIGNSGSVQIKNGSSLELVGGNIPCLGTFTFSVTFQGQYMVTPPVLDLEPDETYEILVVIYMEVI